MLCVSCIQIQMTSMLRHLSSGRLSLACVQVSSLPNMVIKDEIGEHVSSFERLFIFGGQMCF